MTALLVRDFGQALQSVQADVKGPAPRRTEAQVGIREIEILRADVDILAPPEAAELAEHLVDAFRGNVTSGDHLRLPQLTSLDGPSMRSAIGRVLSIDTTRAAGTQSDVIKEERMRRVLRALDTAVSDIQRQATLTSRY